MVFSLYSSSGSFCSSYRALMCDASMCKSQTGMQPERMSAHVCRNYPIEGALIARDVTPLPKKGGNSMISINRKFAEFNQEITVKNGNSYKSRKGGISA